MPVVYLAAESVASVVAAEKSVAENFAVPAVLSDLAVMTTELEKLVRAYRLPLQPLKRTQHYCSIQLSL